MSESEIFIRSAVWNHDREAICAVRGAVFTAEQQIAEDLDLDGRDPDCRHVLAVTAEGEPVGTGRIDGNGHIGRIAVLESWRLRGIGSRIVRQLVERGLARGLRTFYLNAQETALAFYEKLGFVTAGDRFMEAGLPHRCMVKKTGGDGGRALASDP